VLKHHNIRWGTVTHLYATIDLLRRAVDAGGVDYIHVISGQDYPLHEAGKFAARCDGRIFAHFAPVDDESDYIKDRYRLLNLFYFLQTGPRIWNRLYRYLDPASRRLQRFLRISRTRFGPTDTLYKGPLWTSFPASAAASLLTDPATGELIRALRTAYVPEEVFFQTYFLNSPMRTWVVPDDLRYVDWTERNGSIPAFLDETDLPDVLASNALFARKLSTQVSSAFRDQIDAIRFPADDAARRKAGARRGARGAIKL
jgi:hypothetical protein